MWFLLGMRDEWESDPHGAWRFRDLSLHVVTSSKGYM